MQPHLLAALLALRAVAAPQSTAEPPSADLVVEDGVELDGNFIDDPMFEILSNYTVLPSDPNAEVAEIRERPPPPKTVTAEVASKMKSPGGGKDGLFYRGDSRPPAVVFAEGFSPQGTNKDLLNHLSFGGNSGLVSVSRNPQQADLYAFGRSADGATKGYMYVINAKDLPDGYWVPGIYAPEKNPAVARNREFAVGGRIDGSSISHAYEVTKDKPHSTSTKINNDNYAHKKSSSCFGFLGKRATCDPAKYKPEPTKAGRVRAKVSAKFRAGARAGGAVAFAALSPYAHDVLAMVKSWNNPIGHAVSWFDNTMTSIQEVIGGPQVPEIYGNTLELRFICWMRGQQRWKNDVDRACDRLRESDKPKPNPPTPEEKRVKTINNLLDACEKLEDPNEKLANEDQKNELLERCEVFRERAEDATTGNDSEYTYEGDDSYSPPNQAVAGIYIDENGVEHAISW
ncbi:Heat-labile enterotoxin IIA, A chain [Metarhizium guizhouense ARSEF 977]|uniref:Heat-labile enterotoxin IIA, A chain n=1 Tax=Metarhizium guizhouense (strain ARSEF 977) TaxID=1276136 RepID=A0A0B4HNB3_METGA|nr:Heat-labile enterotoxin IIA, A chain [Metarhizium guizhouense ARSEF 977]